GDGGAGRPAEGAAGREGMTPVAATGLGGSSGQATRAASPACPAADQFAVPDDDGATDTDCLPGRPSAAGLLVLVGRHGAGDDDDSVADLGLVHGGPCSVRMIV